MNRHTGRAPVLGGDAWGQGGGVVEGGDGRRVGYAVHGDPRGPVVFCHGGPGSRLSVWGTPGMLAEVGVRLVSIDRPGAGLTDARPGWALLDWPDAAVYRRPEVKEQFATTYREAFRSGTEGAVHDVLLVNLPWGFGLADVTVPVRWWQGAEDPLTPPATIRRAIDGLANHVLTAFEGEGHAVGITRAREIVATLVRPG